MMMMMMIFIIGRLLVSDTGLVMRPTAKCWLYMDKGINPHARLHPPSCRVQNLLEQPSTFKEPVASGFLQETLKDQLLYIYIYIEFEIKASMKLQGLRDA